MNEIVIINEYDPEWPKKYSGESNLISASLPKSITCDLNHVGSTSIPGLAAKPIIDICLESSQYPPSSATVAVLANLGYVHFGEACVPGRHFFKKGVPREFHLHWCPIGGDVAKSQLNFKAVLLKRPDLAARYAQVKRALAKQYEIDRAEYVKAKEPIIVEILND
jgi:GrpB-like predicted nucleotidyltransferase (UPF0157 family)